MHLAEANRRMAEELNAVLEERVRQRTAELETAHRALQAVIDGSPDPMAAMGLDWAALNDEDAEVYAWLADDASYAELIDFLSLEGGPDGGFDDLVAVCQVGLSGTAKLELGKNYWDEMGQGDLTAVHTQLHHDLVAAIDLPTHAMALEQARLVPADAHEAPGGRRKGRAGSEDVALEFPDRRLTLENLPVGQRVDRIRGEQRDPRHCFSSTPSTACHLP